MNSALSSLREQELLVDHEDGLTVQALVSRYSISERTVYRILAKHDVKLTNKRTRKRRKKLVKRLARVLQPCGTNAAYQRHRRAGEYPCESCLAAHSLNVKENKT